MHISKLPRFNKVRVGWQFVKSSWSVLRADKELTFFPVFSLLTGAVILSLFYVLVGRHQELHHHVAGQTVYTGRGFIAWVAMLLLLGVLSNFFTAAIVSGALDHFRGESVSFRKSMRGAWRKVVPLTYFSLYVTAVGILFQLLAERLPFVGKAFIFLADLSWTIANFFALPIILSADSRKSPLAATKESVAVIKKVWGEGVTAGAGMGIIGLFGLLAVVALFVILVMVGSALSLGAGYFIPVAIGFGVGYLVIAIILGALNSILKAALYYYAVTGEAPRPFDAATLQQAIVPKKLRAKRIVSRFRRNHSPSLNQAK